jgi:Big-like domain-containing protein
MKKLYGLSALVSPRVLLGVGLVVATSLFGGTGCGLSYSLTGIYVEPAVNSTCVYPGTTAQFTAYGTYTEGGHSVRIEDISNEVTWSEALPELATVSADGLATAAANFTGITSITATTTGEFGVLTSASSLQVSTQCSTSSTSVAHAFSLHIVPGNQTLSVGQTLQPMAVATQNVSVRPTDLSRQSTWTSSDSRVATVDAHGVITAVGAGDAIITAQTRTSDGESVSATEAIHIAANTQDQ